MPKRQLLSRSTESSGSTTALVVRPAATPFRSCGDGAPRLRDSGRGSGWPGRHPVALRRRTVPSQEPNGPPNWLSPSSEPSTGTTNDFWSAPDAPAAVGTSEVGVTTATNGQELPAGLGAGWVGRASPRRGACPGPAPRYRSRLPQQGGRLNDSFRPRVPFPIFDVAGRPVGLGGRVLPGARGPKYKNTQATPLYDKSRVLYGLNGPKRPSSSADGWWSARAIPM